METATLILAALSLIVSAAILFRSFTLPKNDSQKLEKELEDLKKTLSRLKEEQTSSQSALRQEVNNTVNSNMNALGDSLSKNQETHAKAQSEQLRRLETRLSGFEQSTDQRLDSMRKTISESMSKMTEDNNRQLDRIRGTVDEKLQDTLEKKMNESFRLVSERLEQVYKGLGEMQTIAQGVGDLKNVLSNVKTRGTLGEIQLGAILSDILAPEQYDTEVATIPKSSERVEFAVKLPGYSEGEHVYLPIDSKFNADKYIHLQNAYESGSKEEIAAAKKELFAAVRKNAQDIRKKYIFPPYTTSFGIMFLASEGLYAEIVNGGLVEELQRTYSVNVAGPSTMAAMLNSLQMGFRTLAIQKRSNEVWETLSAVKTEFGKFEEVLTNTQKRVQQVEKDLDSLVGTRTRAINRKLREVETLDPQKSRELIGSEE